jgi:3-methyladenine DNA glycosylase AlkD
MVRNRSSGSNPGPLLDQSMDRAAQAEELIYRLAPDGRSAEKVAGMERFGIRSERALGVSVPEIRGVARGIAKDHGLAEALWRSGIFEARLLAAMVDEPARVTRRQMDRWAAEFDNWAICDGVCQDLFRHSPSALSRARSWCAARPEFVKRAGFSLIAECAIPGQGWPDESFRRLFSVIERGSDDDRPYVRKSVSWALRQIGKRNPKLRTEAIGVARKIARRGTRGARWVASDVTRELLHPTTLRRVAARPPPVRRGPPPKRHVSGQ